MLSAGVTILLLSVGLPVANVPDVLQPCGLLYYPWCSNSHHQSSSQEILAVRGGAKPYYYFQTFQLSPLVVSPEILVAKGGTMWARNGRWILPEMPDFHVAFRNLLHAVNLRHGTDGFTSPRKEGVLRIISPWKIQRLRPGLNRWTWVPKASTLPLDHRSRFTTNLNSMALGYPPVVYFSYRVSRKPI